MSLERAKRILRTVYSSFRSSPPGYSRWLDEAALDRTLGLPRPLPDPIVGEPVVACGNDRVLPAFPGYVAVEVTNACNLKCIHCNYRFGLDHYTRDRGFMSRKTLEKILAEISNHGIPALMNYDGEPLMHRDYLEFLRIATDMGINSYFNTNGTLFTSAFADEIVKFYKGSIFFSVDGSKQWFEKVRVPAKYEIVLGNLNHFLEVNQAHGWPITVGVSLCNLGQSAEERVAFLEEWLPRVNFVSMGEVNDKFGTMTSDPMTVLKVKKRPICSVPWQTCGICHNGDVIPCSIYVTRANTANAIFGNIYDQSIEEIWHGAKFRSFRRMVAEERYGESFCDKCQRWLVQFSFEDVTEGETQICRNGFWTTFQNLKKGQLNFRG